MVLVQGRPSVKPKFEKGQRIAVEYRSYFAGGPCIEFVITSVGANHGGLGNHRYWGLDDKGVGHGAYEHQVKGVV